MTRDRASIIFFFFNTNCSFRGPARRVRVNAALLYKVLQRRCIPAPRLSVEFSYEQRVAVRAPWALSAYRAHGSRHVMQPTRRFTGRSVLSFTFYLHVANITFQRNAFYFFLSFFHSLSRARTHIYVYTFAGDTAMSR